MPAKAPSKEARIKHDPKKHYAPKDPHESRSSVINWETLEHEYVFGRVVEKKKGEFERTYPSLRDLGKRYRIPLPTIAYHSRNGNWSDRREAFQEHLKREFDQEMAKARALSAGDVLSVVDTYIRRFRTAVEADAVGRSSMKDLDTAVRLKAFVQREVDRSEDATATLNLAQLQARHHAQRQAVAELSEAEVGFVPSRTAREEDALGAQRASTAEPAAPVDHQPATPGDVAPEVEPSPDGAAPATGGDSGATAATVPAEPAKLAARRPRRRGWPTAARLTVLWSQAMRAARPHILALEGRSGTDYEADRGGLPATPGMPAHAWMGAGWPPAPIKGSMWSKAIRATHAHLSPEESRELAELLGHRARRNLARAAAGQLLE